MDKNSIHKLFFIFINLPFCKRKSVSYLKKQFNKYKGQLKRDQESKNLGDLKEEVFSYITIFLTLGEQMLYSQQFKPLKKLIVKIKELQVLVKDPQPSQKELAIRYRSIFLIYAYKVNLGQPLNLQVLKETAVSLQSNSEPLNILLVLRFYILVIFCLLLTNETILFYHYSQLVISFLEKRLMARKFGNPDQFHMMMIVTTKKMNFDKNLKKYFNVCAILSLFFSMISSIHKKNIDDTKHSQMIEKFQVDYSRIDSNFCRLIFDLFFNPKSKQVIISSTSSIDPEEVRDTIEVYSLNPKSNLKLKKLKFIESEGSQILEVDGEDKELDILLDSMSLDSSHKDVQDEEVFDNLHPQEQQELEDLMSGAISESSMISLPQKEASYQIQIGRKRKKIYTNPTGVNMEDGLVMNNFMEGSTIQNKIKNSGKRKGGNAKNSISMFFSTGGSSRIKRSISQFKNCLLENPSLDVREGFLGANYNYGERKAPFMFTSPNHTSKKSNSNRSSNQFKTKNRGKASKEKRVYLKTPDEISRRSKPYFNEFSRQEAISINLRRSTMSKEYHQNEKQQQQYQSPLNTLQSPRLSSVSNTIIKRRATVQSERVNLSRARLARDLSEGHKEYLESNFLGLMNRNLVKTTKKSSHRIQRYLSVPNQEIHDAQEKISLKFKKNSKKENGLSKNNNFSHRTFKVNFRNMMTSRPQKSEINKSNIKQKTLNNDSKHYHRKTNENEGISNLKSSHWNKQKKRIKLPSEKNKNNLSNSSATSSSSSSKKNEEDDDSLEIKYQRKDHSKKQSKDKKEGDNGPPTSKGIIQNQEVSSTNSRQVNIGSPIFTLRTSKNVINVKKRDIGSSKYINKDSMGYRRQHSSKLTENNEYQLQQPNQHPNHIKNKVKERFADYIVNDSNPKSNPSPKNADKGAILNRGSSMYIEKDAKPKNVVNRQLGKLNQRRKTVFSRSGSSGPGTPRKSSQGWNKVRNISRFQLQKKSQLLSPRSHFSSRRNKRRGGGLEEGRPQETKEGETHKKKKDKLKLELDVNEVTSNICQRFETYCQKLVIKYYTLLKIKFMGLKR